METLASPRSDLSAVLKAVQNERRQPPVEAWNPSFCGSIDIRIAVDGTWYHEGRPIQRKRMVRLFSSVLRKDEDGVTYLVTPAEKLSITVEDAPLVAVEHWVEESDDGPLLTLRTSLDDVVRVGLDHPMRFVQDGANGGLKPYVLVRGRIEALVNRATTLAVLADERITDLEAEQPVLQSGPYRALLPNDGQT